MRRTAVVATVLPYFLGDVSSSDVTIGSQIKEKKTTFFDGIGNFLFPSEHWAPATRNLRRASNTQRVSEFRASTTLEKERARAHSCTRADASRPAIQRRTFGLLDQRHQVGDAGLAVDPLTMQEDAKSLIESDKSDLVPRDTNSANQFSDSTRLAPR